MSTMTKEERARLRELESKATAGPWREGAVDKHHVFSPDGTIGLERVLLRMNEHFPYVDDAAFIAAARNALVPLIDAVDEAEAKVGRASAIRSVRRWLAMSHEDRVQTLVEDGSYAEVIGGALEAAETRAAESRHRTLAEVRTIVECTLSEGQWAKTQRVLLSRIDALATEKGPANV